MVSVGKYAIYNKKFQSSIEGAYGENNAFIKFYGQICRITNERPDPFGLATLCNKDERVIFVDEVELDILDDSDPIITLQVGQQYDHYFGQAEVTMIDHLNRKMELKYEDGSYSVVDCPSIPKEDVTRFDHIEDVNKIVQTMKEVVNLGNNFSADAQKILDGLHDTLVRKNKDYKDSFGQLYSEFGMQSSVIRLSDKLSRIKFLTQNEANVNDESLDDSLLDLAGYAILTLIEREKEKVNGN